MEFLQPRKVSEHIASSRGFFSVSVFFLALEMGAPAAPANADELQDYAAQCDKAIGVTVPDFDCDAGTDVPGQGSVFSGNHPGASRTDSADCAILEAGSKSWSIATAPMSSPTAARRMATPTCMVISR